MVAFLWCHCCFFFGGRAPTVIEKDKISVFIEASSRLIAFDRLLRGLRFALLKYSLQGVYIGFFED